MAANKQPHPYSLLPEELRSRVNIYVDVRDYNFVRSIDPDKGTVQLVGATLWHRFITKLKQLGITDYGNKQQLHEFLATCDITVPGSVGTGTPCEPTITTGHPTSGPAVETNAPLVGGGTDSARPTNPRTPV
jgi:hypothetical protein